MYARRVFCTDLDNDGDVDVLSASAADDRVAWYENLGGGSFGPQQDISTGADFVVDVHAADLDGDGDVDVVSASYLDDKVAWYENLGGGAFGPQQVVTIAADGANCVRATDVDGDGDNDILTASANDDVIAVHENLGAAVFGPRQLVTNGADGVNCLSAADLNGDGQMDVASSSYFSNTVAWHQLPHGPSWAFSPTQNPNLSVTATLTGGEPHAPYFLFYSSDPLNGSAPGTGLVGGLHISTLAVQLQLQAAFSGNVMFGGHLDGIGSASATLPAAGITSLTGQFWWGVGIQLAPGSSSLYSATNIEGIPIQ